MSALARFSAAPYRVARADGAVGAAYRAADSGHDVLGSAADAGKVLEKLAAAAQKPDLLIITAPEFAGDDLAGLLAAGEAHGVRVMRAPNLTALSPAEDGHIQLQPIAIEDLLNRRQVALDRAGMARLIAGRRVLVTGLAAA